MIHWRSISKKDFLSKLRRVVKDVSVTYTIPKEPGTSGQEDPNFGLITYDYNGVRLQSHDVGAPRALEVLHVLTGTNLTGEVDSPYPGHPIKANAKNYHLLFYLIMPICIIWAWFCSRNFLKCRQNGEINVVATP